LYALLFLAANRRIGQGDIDAVLFADLRELEAERILGVNMWGIETVQQQVHLAKEIGERLGLAPEDRLVLQ
jgi:hypothetical protein